jgi:uncharacterized metal-binding protein
MAIKSPGGAAADKLILVCSGCSTDVGYLADKAARILSVTGQGKLGILDADKAQAVLAEAKNAKQVLVIDGCENGCGLNLAREAGLDCDHLVVTELGLVKGSAPADGKNFDLVVAAARELLEKG